jgi:hypothetical protein
VKGLGPRKAAVRKTNESTLAFESCKQDGQGSVDLNIKPDSRMRHAGKKIRKLDLLKYSGTSLLRTSSGLTTAVLNEKPAKLNRDVALRAL